MMTTHDTASTTVQDARVHDALDVVRKCLVLYGAVSTVVAATLVLVAATHGEVSTFMWVRAGILLLVALYLRRLARQASQGVAASVERLRLVTLVLPIAIVAVDLIPGVCPVWYAGMQAVSAVPLVAVAVLTRRGALRAVSARRA